MSIMNVVRVVVATVLLFSTSASAQSLNGLPDCAQPAFEAALQASGCTTMKCICDNADLIPSVLRSVKTACDPPDQAAVVSFAETYCGSNTVESLLSAASLATVASSTAMASLPSVSPTPASTGNATVPLTTAPTVSSSTVNMTSSSLANATFTNHTTTKPASVSTTRIVSTHTATKTASLASQGIPQPISGVMSLTGLVAAVAFMSWVFAEL